MSDGYQSLNDFVRKVIVDPCLPYNSLATTRSAVKSILREFEALGWRSEEVQDQNSRHPRHQLMSPDGSICLRMNSAKVFRHPIHTEQICQRKHLTKRMLEYDRIPTPDGVDFPPKEQNIARLYFQKMSKPVVVKPTNSGSSYGVTVGVYEPEEFDLAWKFALEDGRADSNVLIEEFVHGVELRALVVGDEVVSVVARVQPFVVGSGSATLETLIQNSNESRKVHYRAVQLPVVVDWEFIEKRGHGPLSVPASGEIVYLNPLGLPANGALLVDVTEAANEQIKDLAVRAKNAIPDLEVGGIDILTNSLDTADNAVVLEVNTAPSLNIHRYATHGKSRPVELDIVNYFHGQYMAKRDSLYRNSSMRSIRPD